MLSIKWIRENRPRVEGDLKRRHMQVDVSRLLDLDTQHRGHLQTLQTYQEERNAIAKKIPDLKKQGGNVDVLVERANALKGLIAHEETESNALEQDIHQLLYAIPNVISPDLPEGKDEASNACVRTWGDPKSFDFSPLTHEVLGSKLGLLRADLGAQMSGSRFVVLQGKLAKLERALGQFMLDLHTNTYGYEEVSPPLLVRPEAAFNVGQLPKFEEDLFKTTTGHYLISTAEVPLTNLVANQILTQPQLPLRYTALTPCFRSEAGAAGKDTKGMIRVHQFYKVELVSITTPEEGPTEHERMLGAAEDVLKKLNLPYRVMVLCSGDVGFSSHKTYDIEVWLPGQNAYREISSCSYFTDYQARRLGTRYRPAHKEGLELVHTLNGSGLAVGRTLVAILENYQLLDGTIQIPEALIPYTGFSTIEGITR